MGPAGWAIPPSTLGTPCASLMPSAFSESRSLAGCLLLLLPGPLPGLLVVLPVLLGTYLAPGLVRDGGAPHATQSPRDLASCRLAWAKRRFNSLRSAVRFLCRSYSCRFCSLASTSAGVGSTRGFGFFTFWLALADFLLDLSLFGVRVTKVLSKMRSLEPPAWAGEPISPHRVDSGCRVYPRVGGVKRTVGGTGPSRASTSSVAWGRLASLGNGIR